MCPETDDSTQGLPPRPEPPCSREQVAASRRRSEALRRAADEAVEAARALTAAVARRRGGSGSFREQMEIWEEVRRTLVEMGAEARELLRESERVEREIAEQTRWIHDEVESMLAAGWNREELAGIGIGDELLGQLGLRDDPRLRGTRNR